MEQENSNIITEKISQLEESIINAKGKFNQNLRDVKIYSLFIALGVLFLVFHYFNILTIPVWLIIVIVIVCVFFLFAILGSDTQKSKSEIEKYEAIKRIYLGFPEPLDSKPEYFDSLVKINIENLAAYYSLVKTHTSQSFKVSLMVSIMGFLLICGGLIIGFQLEDKIITYILTGSGVLIEFISGVLFFLYNKTIRQLKDYHDSLINVQNILLSFKLIENTTDEKVKADMISKMLEYMVNRR